MNRITDSNNSFIDLLVPVTMIAFGRYFSRNGGSKKINMGFGYRTSMSMKNEDTWRFAHTHCGKSWWIVGWVLLPISIGVMLFVSGKDIATVETVGSIISGVQSALLIVSIFPTERALRKNFDKDGDRI